MTKQVRGMVPFLVWRRKLLCIHVYTDIIWCKSVFDIKPGIDPCPLLAPLWDRWWLESLQKVKILFKKAWFVLNSCKDLFKGKKYFGARCTLSSCGRSSGCAGRTGVPSKATLYYNRDLKHRRRRRGRQQIAPREDWDETVRSPYENGGKIET